jgi:hypothetical protein
LPLHGFEPGTVQPELRPLSYLKTRHTFIVHAELQIALLVVAVFGGAVGVYKCVPVTTAWRVVRLRMEKHPAVWRVAVNILNNESRTADKVWFSIFCVRRGANNSLKAYLDTSC